MALEIIYTKTMKQNKSKIYRFKHDWFYFIVMISFQISEEDIDNSINHVK